MTHVSKWEFRMSIMAVLATQFNPHGSLPAQIAWWYLAGSAIYYAVKWVQESRAS